MSLKIEEIALSKLILDEDYCRKVIPFLKDEYFDMLTNRVLFATKVSHQQLLDLSFRDR